MKQKVTSVDVARKAGVSQSLVSLAMNTATQNKVNPKTRELIFNTARELGYRMNMNARNMKTNRANAIGLVSAWDMSSYAYAPVVSGVRAACFERNYALTLCSPKINSKRNYDFKEYYLQNRIDGVVVISYVGFEKEKIFDELKSENIPFTCIIGCKPLAGIIGVDEDFRKSGSEAAKHLAKQGYKNIIFIMKDTADKLNYAENERYDGCMQESKHLNMKFHEYAGFIGCNTEEEYFKASVRLLQDTEKMNRRAVVSTSFECYSILKAAVKLGVSIPKDIGVISLDNEKYNAYLTPPLTSIKQPLEGMGKMAAELLINGLNGGEHSDKIVIMPPQLTVRAST